MGFEVVDGYLLGEPVSKADVVAALLASRSEDPVAAPFYRALEAVGARAADEAFLALRIVLAGGAVGDEPVRRLRALSAIARAAARGDRSGIESIFKREKTVLSQYDLGPPGRESASLRDAAMTAYRNELARAPESKN